MHKLIPVNSGSFKVLFDNNGAYDAVPFQRGTVIPIFERDRITGLPTGRMALRDDRDINAPVVNQQLYSDYINSNTGIAFATLTELIDFCIQYIYKRSDTTGSTSSSITNVWQITTDKPAGATLQDDLYKTYRVATMVINTDIYTNGVNMDQDTATGTLQTDGNPLTFQDGDVVVITAIEIV